MLHKSKLAVRTVFYVPNDPEGLDLLRRMKAALNSAHHRLRVVGRNENRKALAQQLTQAKERYANGHGPYWNGEHASLRQKVPLKHATYFAVYLDSPALEAQLRGQSTINFYREATQKALADFNWARKQLGCKELIVAQNNLKIMSLLEEINALQAKLLAATTLSPSWRRVWADVKTLVRTLISRHGW